MHAQHIIISAAAHTSTKLHSTTSLTNREMPVLVASGLSHEEFHDHIVCHNLKKKEVKKFEAHEEPFYKPPPSAPRGDSHPYAHAFQFAPRSAWASAAQCPDLLAAILLLAGVGLELGYCWSYGYSYSQSDGDDGETSGRSTFQLMVFLVLAFTCAASLSFLKFVQAGGGAVLQLAAFMCVTVMLLCCAVCFALQLTRVALALLLACVCAAYHMWVHRFSLPFAGHALEASSCAVLTPHPLISWLGLFVAALQAAWALVFTTAAVGLQVHNQPSETDDATTMSSTAGVFAFLGLAIVYVWGAQTLRHIVVVSVAGTISTWYTTRNVTTVGAYCRASTSSLGAVAFGSATIAPLGVIQRLLKGGFAMTPDPVVISLPSTKPGCLELSLHPFEFTSLIFVGIYGMGFLEAGRHGTSQLQTLGFPAGLRDARGAPIAGSMASSLLLLGAGSVAMVAGCTAGLVTKWNPEVAAGVPYPVTTATTASTLAAFAVAHTLLSTLEAAHSALLVSYLINPNGLFTASSSAYAQIHDAWRSNRHKQRPLRKALLRAAAASTATASTTESSSASTISTPAHVPAAGAVTSGEGGGDIELGGTGVYEGAFDDDDDEDDRTVTLLGGNFSDSDEAERPSTTSSSSSSFDAQGGVVSSPGQASRLAERAESQSRTESQSRGQSLTRSSAPSLASLGGVSSASAVEPSAAAAAVAAVRSPAKSTSGQPRSSIAAPPPRAGSGFARTHGSGAGRFSDSAPRPEDVAAAAAHAKALEEALQNARAETESVPRGNDI